MTLASFMLLKPYTSIRWRQCAGSCHRDPEEDGEAGPVRDYGADPVLGERLGVGRESQERPLPFPSRRRGQPHLSTLQYARIVHAWIESAGLDSSAYGTHWMRRTKAAQIYRKTGNLRAVQLLLGHTKLESIVRYAGIEVHDALSIAEQVDL